MQFKPPDSDNKPAQATTRPTEARGGAAAATTRVSSQALLRGGHELEIEHNGAVYRLRQTSQGKLILTK